MLRICWRGRYSNAKKHKERMVDILVASDRVRMVVVVLRFHIVVEAVRVGCSRRTRAEKAPPGLQIAFRL